MLSKPLVFIALFVARIFSKLARECINVANDFGRSNIGANQTQAVIASTKYNMVSAVDEPYYADQYWMVIEPHLDKVPPNARILDLGCSQGRFSIRLAKLYSKGFVSGCDISEEAINQARAYALTHDVNNVDFRVQDITKCLEGEFDETADAIFLTEVTFFYPGWKRDMPKIISTLKPGGILVISVRSQYYYALSLVRSRSWGSLDLLLENREGSIFNPSVVFTWQTSSEIRDFLLIECCLVDVELFGIGVCSGIPMDPHDLICRPSHLSDSELYKLHKIEAALGRSTPDAGRYILAVACKPLVSHVESEDNSSLKSSNQLVGNRNYG
jgi:2-polyprenyl-3-methyl-5-hydroxy-6-metoxy-1,4-benzoquinol methylase